MTARASSIAAIRDVLERLREQEHRALVVATGIGLALTTLHWTGLVVAGGLCGLSARTMKRALVSGLGFGVLVWVLFLGSLLVRGVLPAYNTMGQLTLLNVGMTLLLPTLGAVGVRGLT